MVTVGKTSSFQKRIINDLFVLSDKKDFPSGKMVVAIAILGRSVFVGKNGRKTHPAYVREHRNGDKSACYHAECSAIAKVPRQSRHSVRLYVVRFLRNGSISMAKPCNLCQDYLKQNGIEVKNIFYSDWEWNGTWKRLAK